MANPRTQDLNNIQDILLNEYLPFLNNALNVDPSIFMQKIKKGTLDASMGQFGARIGIGGGFGMSGEGQDTPDAHAPLYSKLSYTTKDAYNELRISNKAIQLGRSAKSAMIDAVKDEMDAAYEASAWNVGRMLFGNGSGKLATISAAATSAKASHVVNDTSYLMEGLTCDIYESGGTVAKAGVQIKSIDHATKTVTFDTTFTCGANAVVYVQNSKDKEITGLGTIYDTAITSIYGLTKADNPWLKPLRYSYTVTTSKTEEPDDVLINKAIQDSERMRRGKIDLIMMGDTLYSDFLNYLKSSNTQYVTNNNYRNGFASIKIVYGNREVDVYNERFVPASKAWGVDTSQFELRQTGWEFMAYQGGGIFNLMEGKSVYRACLANYLELICKNPGTCIEIERKTE